MRFIFLLLLTLNISLPAFSQDSTVVLSEPIDIPKEGWNKLLWMKNGNTMLLHFEHRKGIVVKVFDPNHKEIAHQKHICKVLDINTLESSQFMGFMEFNGEGVLFVNQYIDNMSTLLRMRFDAQNAKLLKEEKVFPANNYNKRVQYNVSENKTDDGYNVFYYEEKSTKEAEAKIEYISFNAQHERVRTIPLDMKNEEFDFVSLVGFTLDYRDAAMAVLRLSKIVKFPDVNDYYVRVLYLPKDEKQFITHDFKLPQNFLPDHVDYTYNKFAGNLNLYMTTRVLEKMTKGRQSLDFIYNQNSMLISREDFSSAEFAVLTDKKINDHLKEHGDNTRYVGSIMSVTTNERGLTTIVSRSQNTFQGDDERDLSKYSGNIGLTQYDDHGNEIWGTLLPRSRYYKLALKDVGYEVFGSAMEYSLPDISTSCYKNQFYILYNETPENFDRGIDKPQSPIGDFHRTNTILYHIGKKRELSKKYFFGTTADGEYKHAYANSAHFDEQTGKLAVLMSIQNGDKRTTHIAWTQLGN